MIYFMYHDKKFDKKYVFDQLRATFPGQTQNVRIVPSEQIQQKHITIPIFFKVSKGAKIRNRYNQVPHLTQDTNGKVTNSQ